MLILVKLVGVFTDNAYVWFYCYDIWTPSCVRQEDLVGIKVIILTQMKLFIISDQALTLQLVNTWAKTGLKWL